MELEIQKDAWPVRGRFVIARGARTEAHTLTAVLRVGGTLGRGECTPYARYGETLESVEAAIRNAFAQLGPFDGARARLQSLLPPGAARNALDCALWDLEAKRTGTPVHILAGLERSEPAVTAFTLSVDTPEAMAEAARSATGHPLLKLKLAGDGDIARVRAVRAARPDARLIADANEAWDPADLAERLAALAALGVEMVEQPLPAEADGTLDGLASPVPLGADESAHASADLPRLKGRYACINVKLDKAGGLTEALRMTQEAKAMGFSVMLGCMLASSLAMAPATLLIPYADYVDLDGPLLLAQDREPGLRFDGAEVHPSEPALWG